MTIKGETDLACLVPRLLHTVCLNSMHTYQKIETTHQPDKLYMYIIRVWNPKSWQPVARHRNCQKAKCMHCQYCVCIHV